MKSLSQERAPIYEALERFRKMRVVPFDVPGHKRGRGNPELAELLGQQCVKLDVNSMKPLDNLCHPISVIRDAEILAAEAFGAAHAFLMVGGTTSAVQSMILSVAGRGDKIILPRNVHRSVMSAWCSAVRFRSISTPRWTTRLGISAGYEAGAVSSRQLPSTPDAIAVLVNNPTYYGICTDLRPSSRWRMHRDDVPCGRSTRHPFLFRRRAAGFRHGSRGGYGIGFHAQIGGSLTQSACCSCGPNVHA